MRGIFKDYRKYHCLLLQNLINFDSISNYPTKNEILKESFFITDRFPGFCILSNQSCISQQTNARQFCGTL